MQRWLSRLAFSFLIIAGVLVWQAMHLQSAPPGQRRWRMALYLVAAGMSASLALMGLRVRHRRSRRD